LSKTLTKSKQLYASNKKKLLAIVWAFKNLRNYLYGTNNIEIYTDHDPLNLRSITIALSEIKTNI